MADLHAWIRVLRVALPALAASAAARAEPPGPAETPPPDSAPIAEIVVKGERPPVETTIDRKIYSVAHDLQSTSGSASDVLRNLPSVTVDVDGNPSLRGDSSVTILIDGRLAPEFNNSNRGAALQQLGAENIDRIEVLTNPPANFKRDGSAGVINIITKRRSGTRSTSAHASLGSRGRYNVGGRETRQIGRVSLRGSASVRHDRRDRDFEDARVTRDDTGAVVDDRQTHTIGDDDRLSKSVSIGADFDVSAVDRLTAEGSWYRRDSSSFVEEETSEYSRTRRGDPYEYSSAAQLRYHRAGEGDDGLTVNAERSQSRENGAMRYRNSFALPAQPDTVQDQRFLEDQVTNEVGIDYVATDDRGKLVTGYDFTRDAYLFDDAQTLAVPDGAAMPLDPNFTNTFRYTQTVHALYGSYELPLGQWTWLPGLRLEDTELDIDQVTTGVHSGHGYFRAYPSLHVSRDLDEQQTLTFSYSRRVSRPDGSDLNPFRVQVSEFSVREGNPDLEPSEYDSLEAGWSYDRGRTSRGVTAFARHSRNARTRVTTLLSPTVTLVTPENIGKSLSGGLELSAAGRVGSDVDYNLNGTIFYSEIDAANLGFEGRKSTYSADAKASLGWRATEADTVQLNAALRGRRVTPQGHRPSFATLDLGYRHRFESNLALTATVKDVFASRKYANVLETPELSQKTTFQPAGRIVYVGVSWSSSGAKKTEKIEAEE
jgi:outer membrane cobalamin receptor